MMRLPEIVTGSEYYTCCGKIICSGCGHAPVYDHLGNIGTGDENRTLLQKFTLYFNRKAAETCGEVGDVRAMFELGCCHCEGAYGPD